MVVQVAAHGFLKHSHAGNHQATAAVHPPAYDCSAANVLQLAVWRICMLQDR
jgi:hypothetical protein